MNIILILIGIYMILGVICAFALIIFKDNDAIRKRSLGVIGTILVMITFGLIIAYIIK